MYQNALLREPDTDGYNYWKNGLDSGSMTRAQVALAFIQSTEFENNYKQQDRINTALLYFDMLRRDPDPDGFAYWDGQLDAGVSLESVAEGFAHSTEYSYRRP
jgi:hypothetical protein